MNVLLVRAGALGDLLLLRLAVASLRAAGHRVGLLAPASSGRALVGSGPAEAHDLIDWDRPDAAALFREEGEIPPGFRAELSRFDMAVVYSRSEALVRRLSSVVRRVIAHDPTPPPAAGHASCWLASPLAAERIALVDPVPLFTPLEAHESGASPWLRDLPPAFLAVHPGSGSPAKNWPAERFSDLVHALSPTRPWLLVQGPAEDPAGGRGAILARDLPPRVLGALLGHAGLYVGNDSGVSHLAAAWGAPVLALFGPTDPAVWAPVGPRVRVLRSPTGAMEGLEMAAVEAAARGLYNLPV